MGLDTYRIKIPRHACCSFVFGFFFNFTMRVINTQCEERKSVYIHLGREDFCYRFSSAFNRLIYKT